LNSSKKHLFHIVDPSPWPFLVSIAIFFCVSGFAFYIHRISFGNFFLVISLIFLIILVICWFIDICEEAVLLGKHTKVVKKGLKIGFGLFIISELMLFFGFFWAFFHSSLSPSIEFGLMWPPKGILPLDPFGYPLLNTIILIISGFAVTWAHRAISLKNFKEAVDALIITIVLGFFFILFQAIEYYEASFDITDGVFASTFFLLTGLHGCHVIAGVCFLSVGLFRLLNNEYLQNHYLGFVFAIWYWHFVDIVWILLFFCVYLWGGL